MHSRKTRYAQTVSTALKNAPTDYFIVSVFILSISYIELFIF